MGKVSSEALQECGEEESAGIWFVESWNCGTAWVGRAQTRNPTRDHCLQGMCSQTVCSPVPCLTGRGWWSPLWHCPLPAAGLCAGLAAPWAFPAFLAAAL